MALVAARIILFHVKELEGIQSMLCPQSTLWMRLQQANAWARSHGVRTHPKE